MHRRVFEPGKIISNYNYDHKSYLMYYVLLVFTSLLCEYSNKDQSITILYSTVEYTQIWLDR